MKDAIMLCDDILDLILDLPEAGESFGDDVYEKTISIKQWIQENGFATEKQRVALENMKAGCERFLDV